MMPQDDAKWLPCTTHGEKHWCENTRQSFLDGTDADNIEPGLRYCIPIIPDLDFYAEVAIDPELIGGQCAMLHLVTFTDLFSSAEEFDTLGMWTVGEGRLIIASTINSWTAANTKEKCVAASHGFKQEMEYQEIEKGSDEKHKKANAWCLAYYACCYPCYWQRNQSVTSQTSGSFTATSFGLDPGSFGGNASSNSFNTNARQARARDALQQRFGQQRARRILGGEEPMPTGDNSWPAASPEEAGYF